MLSSASLVRNCAAIRGLEPFGGVPPPESRLDHVPGRLSQARPQGRAARQPLHSIRDRVRTPFGDDQPGQFNKATAQILNVLSLYVGRRSSYGVTELSRELNISKNMAYRALSTLVKEGFLIKDRSGRYELGFGVLQIQDLDADLQFDVRSFCAPFLQRLHKLTGESIFLSVIVGLNHVTIDSVEAHGVRVSHSPRGSCA